MKIVLFLILAAALSLGSLAPAVPINTVVASAQTELQNQQSFPSERAYRQELLRIIASLEVKLAELQSVQSRASTTVTVDEITFDDLDDQSKTGYFFAERDLDIKARFEVRNGDIYLADGRSEDRYEEMWNLFVGLFGKQFVSTYIDQYVIYNDSSNYAAYVETNPGGGWTLGLNRRQLDEDKSVMAELFIHEFAHVLTLNATQVDPFKYNDECSTDFIANGCPYDDSYWQQFVDRFWSQSDRNLTRSWAQLSDNDRQNEVEDFYNGHKSRFVNKYAATNVAEDIAESFAYFVIGGRPDNQTIAAQKVNFFYSWPELVSLRSRIRSAL